jgi:hypothetical protein
MPMIINGDGSITGLSAGGLPNGSIVQADLATGVAGVGPAFSAYASAAQTVTLNTATKVAIDTENFDTNSNFDTTNNRFTPTVAGYYQVNGSLRATVATTFTSIIAYIYKNGSEFSRGQISGTLTATGSNQVAVNNIIYMNGTTDYLELYGLVNGTGTANFVFATAASTSQFSACLVRGA